MKLVSLSLLLGPPYVSRKLMKHRGLVEGTSGETAHYEGPAMNIFATLVSLETESTDNKW